MFLLVVQSQDAYANDFPTRWSTPLPWQKPFVLMLMLPHAKEVESLDPICRKNFMFYIVSSIHLIAVAGTPNAWNIKNAIACAILS
jgi:hypothetical protein